MAHRLSRGLLESQLEALDLCCSLYSQPGEIVASEESQRFIPCLRTWLEQPQDAQLGRGPEYWENEISFTLNMSLHRTSSEEGEDSAESFPLSLSVRLATVADTRTSDLPPAAETNLVHPSWLPRNGYDELSSSIPRYHSATFTSNQDFLLSIVDHLRERGPDYIPERDQPGGGGGGESGKRGKKTTRQRTRGQGQGQGNHEEQDEYRVWLWFPSLSTREKRDDIVNWASDYDLTGFVLAGKPAVMCLEGTENNIQEYMADIKSNSWADIPSFQKKVSERFRTKLVSSSSSTTTLSSNDPRYRIFSSMEEITNLISQSGHKGNRGDMAMVREFLDDKGLGEAFGLVVGGGQF